MKIVLAAILFSSTLLAQAPAPTPDPARRAMVQSLLDAYNAADVAMLQRFASEHLSTNALADEPPAAFARRLSHRHEMTGDLRLLGAELERSERSQYLLESSNRRRYRLAVAFIAGSQTIEELAIDPALSPPRQNPSAHDTASVVAAVEAYMTQLAQDGEFSGAALLARTGRVVLRNARGLADREHNIANTPQTCFNIASIGKIFTQVAIAQLIAQHRLSPDDTVGKWLPYYPSADVRQHVTIAQLLQMRSGIGDFFGPEFAAGPHAKIRKLQDYLPYFASKPLLFRPGTSQQYSNGGYIVLGLIVEAAAHLNYYEYVRDHIFAPAGMKHTGYPSIDERSVTRAVPYTLARGNAPASANAGEPGRGSSAGGAFSTADDLLLFARALFAQKLAPLNALQKLSLPTVQSTRIGILGGSPGVNAALLADAEGNATIVLANADPPAAEELARQIRAWSGEIQP